MPWKSPSVWHFHKWLPLYYPNDPWDVITYDSSGKRIEPIVPQGAFVPWWRQPKADWPYYAPWERKIFGAFPPMWFQMREDIGVPIDPPASPPWPSPDIWPTVAYPRPGGLQHVTTRPDGLWGRTRSPTSTLKVHMQPESWLEISPHPSAWEVGKFEAALREMVRKRPLRIILENGSSITLKGLKNGNWVLHRNDMKAQSARSDFARARAERGLAERAAQINRRLQEQANDEAPE